MEKCIYLHKKHFFRSLKFMYEIINHKCTEMTELKCVEGLKLERIKSKDCPRSSSVSGIWAPSSLWPAAPRSHWGGRNAWWWVSGESGRERRGESTGWGRGGLVLLGRPWPPTPHPSLCPCCQRWKRSTNHTLASTIAAIIPRIPWEDGATLPLVWPRAGFRIICFFKTNF